MSEFLHHCLMTKTKKRQNDPYGRKTEANKMKYKWNIKVPNIFALQNKVSLGASTLNDYNCKNFTQGV